MGYLFPLLLSPASRAQAQQRSTHSSASHADLLPSKAGPFPGQFHRMWLTYFHLVLGHTPDWKRNEFPHTLLPLAPQTCWPLLLGRSAHQVTRPSLRCPLLTVPLSFVNLLSIPTNKPQPLGPQGSLLRRFMKPETTILPPLPLLPSGETVDCPSGSSYSACQRKVRVCQEALASWDLGLPEKHELQTCK